MITIPFKRGKTTLTEIKLRRLQFLLKQPELLGLDDIALLDAVLSHQISQVKLSALESPAPPAPPHPQTPDLQ